MRIGLTGATGFVGRHVLRELRSRGHEAIASSRDRGAVVPGARVVRGWAVGTVPDLSGCEAVIHLAGEPILRLWTRARRQAIRDSRVLGTRAVVEAMRGAGNTVTSLVCASGISFYGDRGDDELTEEAAGGCGFLADVARAWEAEAAEARSYGARVVSGRFGMVLGPDGGAWPLLRRLFGLGLGGRLGSGRQWMSWVHVRDAAALLVDAATDPRYEGPLNVVGPHPLRNADFTRIVARHLGRPAILPAPAWAMKAALRDQVCLFLGSLRAVPRAAAECGYVFAFPTLEETLDDFTKKPRDPEGSRGGEGRDGVGVRT